MALIGEEKRNASVRAIEDCNMIVITKTSFDEKIRKTDATIQAVICMLIDRIRTANTDTLNRKMDVADLAATAQQIYTNIIDSADAAKAKEIEKTLKPEMDRFLSAIEAFI